MGGAKILTAQDVSAELEEVLVGRRLSLQQNITLVISAAWVDSQDVPPLSPPAPTPLPLLFNTTVHLLLVFLDILAVPVVPAARPVLGIPVDPQVPLGLRPPSAHQSPGGPSPHSLLSEETGSRGDFRSNFKLNLEPT